MLEFHCWVSFVGLTGDIDWIVVLETEQESYESESCCRQRWMMELNHSLFINLLTF